MNNLSIKDTSGNNNYFRQVAKPTFLSLPVEIVGKVLLLNDGPLNLRLVSKYFNEAFEKLAGSPLLKRKIQIPFSWRELYKPGQKDKEKICFAQKYAGIDLKFYKAAELIQFVFLKKVNELAIFKDNIVTGLDFDLSSYDYDLSSYLSYIEDFKDLNLMFDLLSHDLDLSSLANKYLNLMLDLIDEYKHIFQPTLLKFNTINDRNITKINIILKAFAKRQSNGLPLTKLAILSLRTNLDLSDFPDLHELRIDNMYNWIQLTLPTYKQLKKLEFGRVGDSSQVKKVLCKMDPSQLTELSFNSICANIDLDLKDFKNLEKLKVKEIKSDEYDAINKMLACMATTSNISQMFFGKLWVGTLKISDFKNVSELRVTNTLFCAKVNLTDLESLESLEIGNLSGKIILNNLENLKNIIVNEVDYGKLVAKSYLKELKDIRFNKIINIYDLANFIKSSAVQKLHLGKIEKGVVDLSEVSKDIEITYDEISPNAQLKLPL